MIALKLSVFAVNMLVPQEYKRAVHERDEENSDFPDLQFQSKHPDYQKHCKGGEGKFSRKAAVKNCLGRKTSPSFSLRN
jgi:hypothetical protein